MHIWHERSDDRQDGPERSYIGGAPGLPRGVAVPVFDKTSTPMTFFFQIELLPPHKWAGHVVSVFAAMDYANDDALIPKLPTPLAGAHLTASFFRDYQTFFRILVFEAARAVRVADYKEKVAFRKLYFTDEQPDDAVAFGRMGKPVWTLDDEAPKTFEGRADVIEFLFQVREDYEFGTVTGAPRQKEQNYEVPRTSDVTDRQVPEYSLFVSNELFFFGIDASEKRVYVIPQS